MKEVCNVYESKFSSQQIISILKNEINSKKYCDDNFRKNFLQKCTPDNLIIEYYPLVKTVVEVQEFKYEYSYNINVDYNYRITESGNINYDSDSIKHTNTRKCDGYGVGDGGKITIIIKHDNIGDLNPDEHWVSNSNGFKTKVDALHIKQKEIVYDTNSVKSMINKSILDADNLVSKKCEAYAKDFEKSTGSTFNKILNIDKRLLGSEVYYCPICHFTCENFHYYLNTITGQLTNQFNYKRGKEYHNQQIELESDDKKFNKFLWILFIPFIPAILSEFIINNIYIFKSFLNPINAEYYESVVGTWIFIIIGMLAFLVAEGFLTLGIIASISENTMLFDFNKKEKESPDKVYYKSNSVYVKKFFSILGLMLLGFAVAGINFGIGYGVMVVH